MKFTRPLKSHTVYGQVAIAGHTNMIVKSDRGFGFGAFFLCLYLGQGLYHMLRLGALGMRWVWAGAEWFLVLAVWPVASAVGAAIGAAAMVVGTAVAAAVSAIAAAISAAVSATMQAVHGVIKVIWH